MKTKNYHKNEKGFATLLSLIIISLLFAISLNFQGAAQQQTIYIKYSALAIKTRQYAKAGIHYAAAKLAEDLAADYSAGVYVDSLNESWNSITKNVSSFPPTHNPYNIPGTDGYILLDVVDLSGRLKANPSPANQAKGIELVDQISGISTANATNLVQNNVMLGFNEIVEFAGFGYPKGFVLSPYGQDYHVNVNTADFYLNPGSDSTANFVMREVFMAAGWSSSSANDYTRRFVRHRRTGSKTDTSKDDPRYDYTAIIPAEVYYDTTVSGLSSSLKTRVVNSSKTDTAALYLRINSEGFFLIHSTGFIPEDPSNPATSAHSSEYQIIAVIKRPDQPDADGLPLEECYWRENWRDDNTSASSKRPILYGANENINYYDYTATP